MTPPVQVPSLPVPRRTQPWVSSYRAFQTSVRDPGRAGIYFKVCSRGVAGTRGCTSMPKIPELLPAQAQIRSGRFPSGQQLSSTKDIQRGEELSLYFRWDHQKRRQTEISSKHRMLAVRRNLRHRRPLLDAPTSFINEHLQVSTCYARC